MPVEHDAGTGRSLDRRARPRSPGASTRATGTASRHRGAGSAANAAASASPLPRRVRNRIDEIAAALQQRGRGRPPRRGDRQPRATSARRCTAIALARALAQHARVVLVDLAFDSPNIDVISNDPSAPGIAELVRGAASFGDIITRDEFSRVHLVAAGQVGGDAGALLRVPRCLLSAVDALAQSYDYLVVDAGAQSEIAIASDRAGHARGRFWSPAKRPDDSVECVARRNCCRRASPTSRC